jgi:23S rRNA pseudouridine2457 synthase
MLESKHRYFILHKPYLMLSQFVGEKVGVMLGEIDFSFPAGTHAIGRLDNASEGLLLLTTNKKITKLLFESNTLHKRCYLVQVANAVSPKTLQQLQAGVTIHITGDLYWKSSPCEVTIIDEPINFQKINNNTQHIGIHTWLRITLTEGKFHQIRKMVFALRHRCKRLIRISIEDLQLGNLASGQVKEMPEEEFFRLLKL